MPSENPHERLAQAALESVRAEYVELSDQWKALDSKAQATGAVAGVLLAGLFAFVRENATQDGLATFLVALATILALAAAFLVVLALQIRTVEPPPLGEQVLRLIENVSDKSESDEELTMRI